MGALKTHEQFLEDLLRKKVDVEVLEEYVTSTTPLECKCKKCGHIWKVRPSNLLNGYGCPVCGIEKRAKAQRKTECEFVQELKAISPDIEFLGPYGGARVPAACHCLSCGWNWNAAPTNLLKGKGCPVCARKAAADKRRRSQDDFITIVRQHNPNIEVLGQFRGNANDIDLKCKECGYKWTTKAGVLVNGAGCPRCVGNGIYSQEEFIAKLKLVNPYIEVLGDYVRAAKPVACKCLRCGNVWTAKPNNLFNGKGCPACAHSTTSFVEQVILGVFRTVLRVPVLSRDGSRIGKELDIYIPDLDLAVEPGSWRWHYDKVQNDACKRAACKKAGIRLITIYSDFSVEEQKPFDDDCICIQETLGYEKDQPALVDLIDELLDLCGIKTRPSDKEWERIIDQAYLSSRRLSTEDFRQRLQEKRTDIDVIGDYTGAQNHIECRCLVCGKTWSPIANNLMKGSGCPVCGIKKSINNRRKKQSADSCPQASEG